ncbi:hypothetical protein BOX15_Mlig016584g2 [Macrostomum lignano]|uniref:Galactose-3-O-sulfotransferase 3 n=3 Tax=Macrostomum lignano TaxID=282301 RepID=A0A1I8GD40_9PLAT|nr:hypothetical protein BOX15_Mlig016584g3 [Macrostomum lignano]PAA63411.1 hypothetical protein BOX15_Mlig016584g2 [Macrostomum lignano]
MRCCVHPAAVKRLAIRSLLLLAGLWLLATAATWFGNQPDDSAHGYGEVHDAVDHNNGGGNSVGSRMWRFLGAALRAQLQPRPPPPPLLLPDSEEDDAAGDVEGSKNKRRRGVERQSFVYLKVIKSASETITSMLRRFGLSRHLSFAMPLPKKIYLGWPNPLRQEYIVLPSGVSHPSVLLDQCVYNRTFLDGLMAKPCVYITSLREPFRQLQSLFAYYNMAEISGLGGRPDAFETYLSDLPRYDREYQSPRRAAKRYCVPDNYSLTKNTMSRILGYVEGQDADKFVASIIADFDLILITDYFMHSLVLLKRLMNWSFKDILFVSRNIGRYPRMMAAQRPDLMRVHQAWSPVDYKLYQAANASFWRRVAQEGPSFRTELRVFRSLSKFIRRRCRALERGDAAAASGNDFTFLANRWSPAFSIGPMDCRRLGDAGINELQRQSRLAYTGDKAALTGYPYC